MFSVASASLSSASALIALEPENRALLLAGVAERHLIRQWQFAREREWPEAADEYNDAVVAFMSEGLAERATQLGLTFVHAFPGDPANAVERFAAGRYWVRTYWTDVADRQTKERVARMASQWTLRRDRGDLREPPIVDLVGSDALAA